MRDERERGKGDGKKETIIFSSRPSPLLPSSLTLIRVFFDELLDVFEMLQDQLGFFKTELKGNLSCGVLRMTIIALPWYSLSKTSDIVASSFMKLTS